MPYVVTTSLYPYEKASECGEKWLEALKKYPYDENLGTMIVPAAVKSTLDGTTSIGILEVKEGKLEEALIYTGRFMSVFRGIEGFTTSIDVYYTGAEAMANVGMTISE
jgi:hypothetical protein